MNSTGRDALWVDMTNNEGPATACGQPERRQFDFWLGEWEVRDPEGTRLGRNRVDSLFGGCALREEWRGESGLRGTSLNAWSPSSRAWHQSWVDSSGTLLLLEGGLRDGVMVLEGSAPLPGDPLRAVRHRISWSVIDGDTDYVRQHWQTTGEDGAWETVFDGRYRRIT